jgi:hypothetical protein
MNNIIGIWPNVFRAIEIAKTGNFTVSIVFEKDYENGFDDFQMIKEFCKGWFDTFVKDGDIAIELHPHPIYELANQKGFETLGDISKRIEKTLLHTKPELNFDSSSLAILKMATEKLNLSFKKIEKIKLISAVIAQMDLSDKITACHIAEAIQYYVIDYNNCIFAGNKEISFDGKITISLLEIDPETISNAIAYLTKLQKD